MHSTVMRNLQTLHLLSILALACLFIKKSGSNSVCPVLTGPDMAYLGSRVAFHCVLTAPDSSLLVTYELMRDGDVLIGAVSDLQGDQPASFFQKVAATSEGSYHCKATAGQSTGVSNSIKLSVVIPASNTRVTSEPFPPVAYVGSDIVLSCNVSRGSHLSFAWFFNKKKVTPSTSPFLHLSGNNLVVGKVTAEHAGNYSCMAWSRVMDIERFSSSSEVQLTVKVYVSKPRISFSISKEADSYYGNVTCWSTRGSPPVNFSLLLDEKEIGSVTATEHLTAWFSVTMVPGRDMGVAQCRVTTEVQELMSEPVTLEVAPVGGGVKVDVEYLYRADSKLAAARLSCQISRGTFPYISWLLNDSVLPSETHMVSHIQRIPSHYALTDHRRTLIVTKPGLEESGYYRCRARDSYDDSGPWVESAAVLVQVTEHHMNTIEVITMAFCCFLLFMLAVGAVCVFELLDHKQVLGSSSSSDALPQPEPASQSGAERANASSADCDVENQTVEITV